MKKMKKIFGAIIVILLSYWMVRPLLAPGYFPMHDDTQVARVVEMGRALREGQFPVRWVSDLGYGYGYPIFNFYGPLPYYAGGALYALGINGLTATKLMMGLGLVAAGITMYVFMADVLGVAAGILAAVLYMYAPYHAVDAYVRGAVGEYWALVFLPLIAWGFLRKKTLIGSAALAGLILSHTILGYVGVILTGIWVLVTKCNRVAVTLTVLGLGLSAFFWFPAITEMKYTNVASQVSATSDFHDHFVCLPQLWNSPWGYGGSAKGCLDGLSFKVGKIHLTLGLASLAFVTMPTAIAGLSVFLVSVFFMLPVSARLWEILPMFSFIQYPWRFLAFSMFGISVLGVSFLTAFKNRYIRYVLVILLIAVVLLVEAKWFMPQYMYGKSAQSFEAFDDIAFRVSKISDEYLPAAVKRPQKPEDVPRVLVPSSESYTVEINQNFDTYKKVTFIADKEERITINMAYFPGWHVMVNDSEVTPVIESGLPVITIPRGLTVVQMRFTNTPVRTAADLISLVSLGFWIYLYDRKNKKTVG